MNDSVLLSLLTELRSRLIKWIGIFLFIYCILLLFSNQLYTLFALPLLKHLPQGQGIIATQLTAPFFIPFELAFYTAIFFSMPSLLYQLWGFIAPALYQQEKKWVWLLLFLSGSLFYCGVFFCYWVIFPILFAFLTHSAPRGVLVMPDISQYLELCLKLFLVFGIMFEIPVLIVLLVRFGTVSRRQLIRFRPYAIILAFVIAMLLAPPDVLSQCLLAFPLWILFEIGVFLAHYFVYDR